MVVSLSYELQSFAAAVVMGFLAGIVYDAARSVGCVMKKKAPSDVIMWLCITSVSCVIWYRFQNGELRWYTVTGALMSAVLYFLLISRVIFCVFSSAVRKIRKFFERIFKILLTPIKFLCKMISVYIRKAILKIFVKVEDEIYEKKAGY